MDMNDNKDTLFSTLVDRVTDFTFNEQVAQVFPNMIQRSIPGYNNIISTIGILAKRFAKPYSRIYDLGCSLGAATISMHNQINQKGCRIIAVDSSNAMVQRCKAYLNKHQLTIPIKVIKADIRNVKITNASVVVLNFTLQFINPKDRQSLLENIYSGLRSGGILILSEKYIFENDVLNKLLIKLHHDFKRKNGYSELEIKQKLIALENVIYPDSIKTHKIRFKDIGFSSNETWFQYFNFGAMIAIK
ncbi:methyltransferase [Candidatus Photodesmus katoptron Akat1]|uniref:Carboxy-S-adenosyl-L-methionine synthase n=2 Tax=Candidatus Photodesmus anomalopis TaxID=28176 RepID=S3DI90_9GAMM|nr:methyltransferase [Candidatus Photodesmus katoptron Akat1]